MKILKQYIENDKLITEYTKDGINVSHKIETPIEEETSGDKIVMPANPILALQEENKKLQQQLSTAQKAINDLILQNISI